MNYSKGDVVILPFPFVISKGIQQKARPALVISNHLVRRRFDDLILAGITSQRTNEVIETEMLINEKDAYFNETGLLKTFVIRFEYLMTIPKTLVRRRLGQIPQSILKKIDEKLKLSLGLN